MTAPNVRIEKMTTAAVEAYAQELLAEVRRCLVELEKRRAAQSVSHLTPEQRRAQIRTVKP